MVEIGAMFTIAVALLSWISSHLIPGAFPMMVGDAFALVGAYYLYIAWDKRPIRMACPKCNRIILSNTPWFCAECEHQNRNTTDFPFVHKCEKCGTEPKAYRCHHSPCSEILFFSEDKDATNYTYRLNFPGEAPKLDERTIKLAKSQEIKEDKREEVAIAELDLQLKEINEQIKGPKIKTPLEQKIEMADRFYEASMGIDEHCRKRRAEAAELYKNDPERYKKANDVIKDIERRFT